ncbi:MAG: Lrp/AsnC ligand binding domain-containing protein [Thaumarchaeota archaeon]|nr:Lrp/AsnC ligand binding domain-containing protein [Nitrososphaerota archaeon]MDE1843565.1 Lrp/AsnC ligand binding domain-containing protein [Nitrososphaerota archaeon]
MITCEDCTTSIINELESIPEVKEIYPTCGNYDVIVKIETESVDIMKQVIMEKIRKIEQIRSTTILISSPVLIY